jgi:glycosyltransferase involved in cell wall biosynthesis
VKNKKTGILKVGRIGSYPTTYLNTAGKYAFEICKHDLIQSYIVSPSFKGEPLIVQGLKGIITYRAWPRNKFPKNFLKVFHNFYWIIYLILIQTRAIVFFMGKGLHVVHIHSQMYTLVAFWAQITFKKVVITFHGEDYNNLMRSTILQKLLYIYNKIFIISPEMLNGIKQYYKGSVIYTPNGVDNSIFRNLRLERKRVLLCVASFKKVKRHELLLDAFSRLKRIEAFADYELWLAGEGELKETIRQKSENLSLNKSVVFLGNLTSKDLAVVYNQAEALILCSEREGFPKVVLEALSCQCPVIATRVGSLPWIFDKDYSFWLQQDLRNFEELIISLKVSYESKYFDVDSYSWESLRLKVYDEYIN